MMKTGTINVLVTGANGQVGMNIIEHLSLTSNFNIFGMYGKNQPILDSIICYPLDLTTISDDDISLQSILKKQDIVIHTAGYINICPKNDEEKKHLANVNQFGTINFFKNCEIAGVETMIYISSIEAFLSKGVFRQENLYSNEHTTLYGSTKANATNYFEQQSTIPRRLTIYPSGIISCAKNKPSPLMNFIYSIPTSYFQFYPKSTFHFLDGEYLSEKVCNYCENGLPLGLSKSIMLGRESSMSYLINVTKRINKQIVFPIAIPIPNWLLYYVAEIGEYVGSTELNSTVFKILNSTNELVSDEVRYPPLTRTIMMAFPDENETEL